MSPCSGTSLCQKRKPDRTPSCRISPLRVDAVEKVLDRRGGEYGPIPEIEVVDALAIAEQVEV
jgi:hypothetical protein